MAEAAEVAKTTRRERGAEPKSALALVLFLALVTCHSTLLFGQRFSHVQGAMVQVTSAWTSSPFTLSLASNPAQGDLVVAVFASLGCTNGGPSPLTITDANGNSYTVISTPATLSQGASSGLCSGGTVYANLWLGYLLSAPSNASSTIQVSWSSGQALGDVWADEFNPSGGSVTLDTSASSDSIAEQAAHFATLGESHTTGDTLARQASYWRADCISLTWTPPAGAQGNPAYSYNVYRGTSPGKESGPINPSPVDAGCTSQANCTYVDYGPQAGAEYYYTVTAASAGAQSLFSNESGAAIPQDAVMETNAANDVVSRGWAGMRSATENLLAYDSLTAGSFVPVQPQHSFVVPGRTKTGEAPIHREPPAAPP
jgi:hypothetical protein